MRLSATIWRLGAATMMIAAADAHGDSSEALRDLGRRYWDAYLEHHPTRATSLGDHRFNDRLEDLSAASRQRRQEQLRKFHAELRKLPSSKLSEEDRLTRALLERTIADAMLLFECRQFLTPLDPLYGPHIRFPLILVSQPFGNAEDFRNYVSRLRAFPEQVRSMIADMRTGVAAGITSPRIIVEKVIPQIRAHIVADPRKSEFYKPIAKADNLGLSPDERTRIEADVVAAIRTDVVPAFLQLLAFVEDDYLHKCRSTIGLGAIVHGDRAYQALTRIYTTVPITVDEIHGIGLDEVRRLRGELDKVRGEMGFEGDLEAFIKHMREDPKYRAKSAEDLLAQYTTVLERTKPLMAKLFGRLPQADCVTREMEPFRAEAAPAAYYNPSPEDGSRPAYFYVNTYQPEQRPIFTMEALTYHETVPGHHLQMSLDAENKSLPSFRRFADFTAYVEGWALYAERLGYEFGGYKDAAQRYGQLTFEIWRACRLVVDTGIHAKEWTRQEAVDYMVANSSLALVDIAAEVDRYITWPGQALAYKIGELRIQQIRKDTEKALGQEFDIRAFHDELLSGGAMPIDILEIRMMQWVKSRSGR